MTHLIQLLRELRDPSNYLFNLYAAPVVFTFFAITSLGLFVLVKERRSAVTGSFFLVTSTVGVWLLAFGLMYSSANEWTAYRWAKIAHLAVPFIPAATYYFTIKVLRLYERKRKTAAALFCVSALSAALIVGAPWVFDSLYRYPWGYYPKYTPWSFFYLAFFFSVMAVSLKHFFIEYRRASTPTHRARIRLLLVALCVAYLSSGDYLAKFGIPVYPFGYAGILIFVVITSFVVTVYRLVDITPSFAAEKIIGTMGDALLVLDSEDIVRVANDQAAELFGASKNDLVGSPLASVSAAFPVKSSTEHLHRVGTDHAYEIDHETPSGRNLILSVSESPMKDEKGCVIAMVLIIRDLTQMKLTETALKETESRLTKLYRETPEALIILDEFGRFSSANPAAEKLLGFSGEKVEGKIFVMSRFLPNACVSKMLKAIRGVMQGQTEDPFELELIKEDGSSVKVEAMPSPVRKQGRIAEVQFLLKSANAPSDAETVLEKEKARIERSLRAKLEEMFKDDVYLMRKLEKLKF